MGFISNLYDSETEQLEVKKNNRLNYAPIQWEYQELTLQIWKHEGALEAIGKILERYELEQSTPF